MSEVSRRSFIGRTFRAGCRSRARRRSRAAVAGPAAGGTGRRSGTAGTGASRRLVAERPPGLAEEDVVEARARERDRGRRQAGPIEQAQERREGGLAVV